MKYGFLNNSDKKFPPILHVENTNICNLKCIHCPQANPYELISNYKPQNMKFDLWKKIVDEVVLYKTALRLTPDGETMMPNDWCKFIDYALKKNIYLLTFNTNGFFLENDKLEVLLQPSKTKIAIEISLDALWKNSYDKIRKKSDYIRVYKNIFTLLEERKKRNLSNIKIMVSCINQPELEDNEFNLFIKYWEDIVDKVITRTYVNTKGLTPEKKSVMAKVEKRWPCLVLFTRLVISMDGKVRFCPDDWKKETVIGDVYNNSIAEIWQNEQMNKLREMHLNYCGEKAHPTCAYCTDWKAIKWGYDYTKVLNDLFE